MHIQIKRIISSRPTLEILEIYKLKIEHRTIDLQRDRDFLLEMHCRINYECEMPWVRETPYSEYRETWLQSEGVKEYLDALSDSMQDSRTIADIWENAQTNEIVAYVWMIFHDIKSDSISFAELQDIAVVENYRRQGIAERICDYCINAARKSGAKMLRSGTGASNIASRKLHEKLGLSDYRVEYEKLLD